MYYKAGVTTDPSHKGDDSLSEQGKEYAEKMAKCIFQHRESTEADLKPLTVWTSTRRRTVETAKYLQEKGYKVRHRSQMSQLNPGVCEMMSESQIRLKFPEEVVKHELDPYHHRYPRSEVGTIFCIKFCLLNI